MESNLGAVSAAASSGAIPLDDLRTIEGFANEHPEFLTVPTLRWQLRHRDTNGLASATVRVGKRLLISRTRYQEWLATRAGTA